MKQTRRAFLVGTVASIPLSGCLGSGNTSSPDNNTSENTQKKNKKEKENKNPNEPIEELSENDVVDSSHESLVIAEHDLRKGEEKSADIQDGEVVLSDIVVDGVVENTGSNDLQNVTVTLTLLDENRNTIGRSDDWREMLESGSSWEFDIIPDVSVDFSDVETYRLDVTGEKDTSRIEEGVKEGLNDK